VINEPWTEHARCVETDPEIFYPTNGGIGVNQTRQAKNICRQCPVRAAEMPKAPGGTGECLEDALKRNDEYGVWGGLTAKERKELRRQRNNARRRELSA
jgi:WhiB family transcriptional regulator, redox-sensing transcriptional regulator